ncbi:hypothetical protein BDF20DRAFT_830359 [Mycotypha africana]|uniref:uncharacterized protein n=1 Tax=Mycotypha africana TaxID=64632 RepID=UPI002300A788|nr:uncharacterized protein BDF20DRAFT_830359 [Mycotypha africana]KAI8967007.1 hypothetical protein BDF20DRAFT_830359 [Mycotypha africana]
MGQYKCCRCIPARAGVMIIALISTMIYLACTVSLFLTKPYSNVTYNGIELNMSIINGIYYASIAISIIFALASILGVIGSIVQQRKMIAIFKISYWTMSLIQFLLSVITVIVFVTKRTEIIEACAAYPEESLDTCTVYYRNFMISYGIIVFLFNFIQFYFASVISAYATRLRRTNMHEKLRDLEDFPEPLNKTEFF